MWTNNCQNIKDLATKNYIKPEKQLSCSEIANDIKTSNENSKTLAKTFELKVKW